MLSVFPVPAGSLALREKRERKQLGFDKEFLSPVI